MTTTPAYKNLSKHAIEIIDLADSLKTAVDEENESDVLIALSLLADEVSTAECELNGPVKAQALSNLDQAFSLALKHSQSCRRCFIPIVKDAEGNPGLYGEACPEGRELLKNWQDAEKALS